MSEETGLRSGLPHYGDREFSLYLRKAFIKAMGYSDEALNWPIVAITNTFSGYNACHRTVPEMIEAIKRGVLRAGGLPIEFPIISIHESFSNPTSMFLRNLMAMTVEEMIRAQPMDAVVLIGGCDKTVPALLMGAANAGVPAILTVTGPMLTGNYKGEKLGACTDCRRYWGRYRAGEIDAQEIESVNNQLAPSAGTCTVMGTASTMALISETMGMMLSGGATIPAPYADRLRHCEATGVRAVEIGRDRVMPHHLMTKEALQNAMCILHAVGGSTNGLIHLAAIAGRLGFEIDLGEFDAIGRKTPVLVDLKPAGNHYMEDLHAAGGLVPILRELKPLLNLDCMTVDGKTIGQILDDSPLPWPQDVIRPLTNPISPDGSIRVLRGNLAPNGAVIKHAAASIELFNHVGRAVVFDSLEDMAQRIDSPDLDVDQSDILVLRNAGPKGAPGMPEAGYIPIPRKLASNGVRDMVRISDARMSGTAFGTIVLHVSPESAIGGPLGLVRNGDMISLNVEDGRLELLISEEELQKRKKDTPTSTKTHFDRGYFKLYQEEVNQAENGCDFNFLRAKPL